MNCPFCSCDLISEKPFKCSNDECRSKSLNRVSKEFLKIKNGWTDKQVSEYLRNKTSKGHKTTKETGVERINPNSREAWRLRGLSEEEIDVIMQQKGEKVSKSRKDSGIAKGKNNNASKERMKELGMTDKEIEFKTRSRIQSCPEYWIKRCMSEEDAKIKAKECGRTITKEKLGNRYDEVKRKMSKEGKLQSLIEEYGEELAEEMFIEKYIRKSFIKVGRSSQHAMRLFKVIYKKLRKENFKPDDFFIGTHKRNEMFIRDGSNIYFYDFVIKPLNLIFEFNGTHVHPSPLMTEDERIHWRHAYSKKTADEVEEVDKRKKVVAENHGYVVLYLYSNITDEVNLREMEKAIYERRNEKTC